MLILTNSYLQEMLDDQQSMQLVMATDNITEFVLTSVDHPELRARIDGMNAGKNMQLHYLSCAARAIMQIELDMGLISQEEYTSSKELDIYRKIWFGPGDIAIPEKIIDYCKMRGLKVIGEEVNAIIQKKLISAAAAKEMSIEKIWIHFHSLFRQAQPQKIELELNQLDDLAFFKIEYCS